MTNLIKTKHGYYRFDPIPEVDYSTYYTDEKPLCIANQIEDKAWWDVMYEDRLRVLENAYSDGGVILDVGCGAGMFLARAREWGWATEGIDPSETALKYAKDTLGLYVSTTDITSLKSNHYSAIHCSEVLEHVPDPERLLKHCHRVLRKNGMICVCVPNDFNPLQMILKQKYGEYWVSYPWHINYFSFDSLSSLMAEAGFTVIYQSAMYPLEIFALFGVPYIGNDKLGRFIHRVRMKMDMEMSAQERSIFYEEMTRFGIGREAIIYGIK